MRKHHDTVGHVGGYDPSGSWRDPADRIVTVKLHHVTRSDKNDIIIEILKSYTILIDKPSINNGMLLFLAGVPRKSTRKNNPGKDRPKAAEV